MARAPCRAGVSLVPSRAWALILASPSPGAAAARAARPAGAAPAPLQQRFPPLSVLLCQCKPHIFISTFSSKADGPGFDFWLL